MNFKTLAQYRLVNQQLTSPSLKTAGELVHWMGAMQAQDYAGAKWSIGVRLGGMTDAGVEEAVVKGEIIRTWALRGTWHWVAPADVHWMVGFVCARIQQKYAKNLRDEGLEKSHIKKANNILVKSLQGGQCLTREELAEQFGKKGIKTSNYGVGHLLLQASMEGLICMGPRKGKQFTHVLLDEWVPEAVRTNPAEPLAELAGRYFKSHGPATVRDFMWWAGITLTEARRGVDMVQDKLLSVAVNGETYWHAAELPEPAGKSTVCMLPGFDEFLLGYSDRSVIINEAHAHRLAMTANGQFSATIVAGGQVEGVWKRTLGTKEVKIERDYFEKTSKKLVGAVDKATKAYGKFLGLKPVLG